MTIFLACGLAIPLRGRVQSVLTFFQVHLHHHQGEPDQQGQQQLVQAPHDHLQDICPVSTKCSNDVDLSGLQIFCFQIVSLLKVGIQIWFQEYY